MANLSELDIEYFNALKNFINDVQTLDDSENVTFYAYLLDKTCCEKHKSAVIKHISIVDDFVSAQIKNIKNDVILGQISYSPTIYVNVTDLYNLSDNDNKQQIVLHLLGLVILYEKRHNIHNDEFKDKAVSISKKLTNKSSQYDSLSELMNPEFISNVLSKVSNNEKLQNISQDSNQNPSELISTIIDSGVIADIMGMIETKDK